MRTTFNFRAHTSRLLFLSILVFVSSGCYDKVEISRTYTVMEPVYMSPAEIREAVEVTDARLMQSAGKIYLYQQYLFVNEPGKGIHVINNMNPESPA